MLRKLTEYEYMYCWYIEYGTPYHYIPTPPEIGTVIKTLISDNICIQLPNPTIDASPLYTRFTHEGRMLFLVHEWLTFFRHPAEIQETTYDNLVDGYDFDAICQNMTDRMGALSIFMACQFKRRIILCGP